MEERERERWRRERRHEEETTQQGWTVVHSLYAISVTFPTSHAERSPLNLSALENTDDGERGHRERRRRRRRDECECGIRNGKERERRRRHEEDNTRMDSSTLTVTHIGDPPDIPCREVSVELIRRIKH